MELGFSDLKDKLNKEQTIQFYYRISYLYFGSGLYKNALKWVNKILNDNEQILRQDIYSFAKLFNLILHYELNNYDLLDYITKSTLRFLKKSEKNYKSDLVLIKYLKQLIKANTEGDKKIIFEQAKKEFELLFLNNEEKIILQFIDVISWFNSKINDSTFETAVKHQL